jgi:Baseplate J-like protein
MALTSPNLDDRTFEQLLDEAKRHVMRTCPAWTDLSPSDPGMVLLELFAFLTETMIYRLNRLPDKAYVEFLRLMGVKIHPPGAARVLLRFGRVKAAGPAAGEAAGEAGEGGGAPPRRVEIPRGTRVTIGQGGGQEPPVFATSQTVTLEPGKESVDVLAFHAEQVDGEPAGKGTGMPGLSVNVRRPPIVAPTGDAQDLDVGVEAGAEEIGSARSRQVGSKVFRMWEEVENFAEPGDDLHVYVADRASGTITFAPAVQSYAAGGAPERPEALGAIPPAGREVRVWYRRGGGPSGNVAAGTLTSMKDPIAGVEVTNPLAATGGRDGESLANALLRGPQELHSLKRAVTARDFEQVAASSGAVARARAFTKRQVWSYASPGTVQILLVPDVPDAQRGGAGGALTLETLRAHETEDARRAIESALNERRPLGTAVQVNWIGYKVVRVRTRVIVYRGEDRGAIAGRVLERINQYINPLPTPLQPTGWPFGQPLHEGRVYELILGVPGVKGTGEVQLLVDDVPEKQVKSITADWFQSSTWYVVAAGAIFRSLDDGEGWEKLARLPGMADNEELQFVRSHRGRAGWLLAVTHLRGEKEESNVYVSDDCGDTWRLVQPVGFIVNDAAWIMRDAVPAVLMASSRGLWELAVAPGGKLGQLIVGDQRPDLGFWAVTVATDVRGRPALVAVAAYENKGVWVSYEEGRSKTYISIKLNEDVRVLMIQYEGARAFLWAGLQEIGNVAGKGCFRWGGMNEEWKQFIQKWAGGACLSLTSAGSKVYAATYGAGVLVLDTIHPEEGWKQPGLDSGLPLTESGQTLAPVRAVAADPDGKAVLAGGDGGVLRLEHDRGRDRYRSVSTPIGGAIVTLPHDALFCCGNHEITVVGEDDVEEQERRGEAERP